MSDGKELEAASAAKAEEDAVVPDVIELHSVPNFRDLYSSWSGIKPGRLLRSSTPAIASPEDVALLMRAKICAVVDLREEFEAKTDPGPQLLRKKLQRGGASRLPTHPPAHDVACMPALAEDAVGNVTEPETHVASATRPQDQGHQASSRGSSISSWFNKAPQDTYTTFANQHLIFYLPFAARSTMQKALFGDLPFSDKFRVAGMFLYGKTLDSTYERKAKDYMLEFFNTYGLDGLNRIILKHNGQMVFNALRVVALSHGRPVLINCSHGKDRTGLLVALILLILGCPKDVVVADYCKSDAHGTSPEGRARFAQISQLDVDKWCRAVPEVMENTIAFIEDTWGSVDRYCESIGFHTRWRQLLRHCLLD